MGSRRFLMGTAIATAVALTGAVGTTAHIARTTHPTAPPAAPRADHLGASPAAPPPPHPSPPPSHPTHQNRPPVAAYPTHSSKPPAPPHTAQPSAAPAAPRTGQLNPPATPKPIPAPPGDGLVAPLQEFRTSRYAGWYYALNAAESAFAAEKFRFVKQGSVGAMRVKPGPGTVAVHRLRVKVGDPSYLLSISPTEISDPRFADEGVIGYLDTTAKPGLVRLLRLSNNGQWRVALESRANAQRAAGYALDGTLGWMRP